MKRTRPTFRPSGYPVGSQPTADPADISPEQRSLRSYALQLARIEAALARMEAGQYGRCTQCNAPIPIRQLEADPAMSACLDCVEPSDQPV